MKVLSCCVGLSLLLSAGTLCGCGGNDDEEANANVVSIEKGVAPAQWSSEGEPGVGAEAPVGNVKEEESKPAEPAPETAEEVKEQPAPAESSATEPSRPAQTPAPETTPED